MGNFPIVGAMLFTLGCWLQVHIWIGCISVAAVTATYGFALTASHLEEPQVTK
ncbi:hypothetical protein PMI35_05172, partial [Pseudomonas sp. GM78]